MASILKEKFQITGVYATVKIIGSKWTLHIINELMKEETLRFWELEENLAGISPRTLSLRLESLARYGVVERKVYPEVPPKVEYKLTKRGRDLMAVITEMEKWGKGAVGAFKEVQLSRAKNTKK